MKEAMKFDGNSLVNARQFKKATGIIKSDKSRKYMAPSAPGKRGDKNEKVTDLLYTCYNAVAEGKSYKRILEKIKSRYMDIIDDPDLSLNLDHEFDRIEKSSLAKAGRDYTASCGECLDSIVVANFLGFEFMDTTEVISFDENGNFESEHTNRGLSERLEYVEKAIIPGFYGSGPDGTIRTFSRSGSDVASSIVAKAIHADMYENWTDVSDVLMTNPRTMENPEVIETVTYKELRELSYMGASVLHEDAIFPVHREGIPINIRNTNRPKDKGTPIVESTCRRPRYTVTGIADKEGFHSINIKKAMMNAEVGFGRKVLSVSEQCGISFEHMPSGIDTVIIYVYQPEFEKFGQSVIAGIHRTVEPDTIEPESDLTLIIVVGRGMHSTRGTADRIFSALAHAKVDVRMIDQNSSERNIIIGVENDGFETAVRAIYDIFITTEL